MTLSHAEYQAIANQLPQTVRLSLMESSVTRWMAKNLKQPIQPQGKFWPVLLIVKRQM